MSSSGGGIVYGDVMTRVEPLIRLPRPRPSLEAQGDVNARRRLTHESGSTSPGDLKAVAGREIPASAPARATP